MKQLHHLKRLLFLPLLFLLALPAYGTNSSALTSKDKQAIIQHINQELNAYYLYPKISRKMTHSLENKFTHHDYNSIKNLDEFSKVLTADLQSISHDQHLVVIFSPDPLQREDMLNAMIGVTTKGLTQKEKEEMSTGMMSKDNFGFAKAEVLPGNVGYLKIRFFLQVEYCHHTADAAMSFIANTDALIIDLRDNHGGQPALITYLLSYVFDDPTHVNDIYSPTTHKTHQWWTSSVVPGLRYGGKKPIYVLTSSSTFSGGEEFAYDLQSLKRATIVGEKTKGGAHPVRLFRVTSHLAIAIPYAEAINPITGTNWEGKGVIPNVIAPSSKAFDIAYTKSLEDVLKTASEEPLKETIRNILHCTNHCPPIQQP